jgi:hypothetical protein
MLRPRPWIVTVERCGIANPVIIAIDVRAFDGLGTRTSSSFFRSSALCRSSLAINLEWLVRDHGLELSEALSRYVSTGIMSRNEARRNHGAAGPPRCR